jgi:hypothetical protein
MPSCVARRPKGTATRALTGYFGNPQRPKTTPGLLLPGAFFVAVGAQLFAAFMFIYFAFAAFL